MSWERDGSRPCRECQTGFDGCCRRGWAVGQLAVLSAKQLGAERIIVMSRHQARQALARESGRRRLLRTGQDGIAHVQELTHGVGADSVLECGYSRVDESGHTLGTAWRLRELRRRASRVQFKGEELFFTHVHLHGGPAPVRRFLPHLIDLCGIKG